MRGLNPRYVLALSAAMLLTGIACAALGLSAARAAKQSMRPVPIARYSGPLSGALIEDRSPLRQVLPEVKLQSMTFGQAIDALRRTSGANIFVNWRRLDDLRLDIRPDMPLRMDLQLKNVTLGQALAKVLECAEPPRQDYTTRVLGCGVRDGIITISDDRPTFDSVGRWYYIQDLINHPAHYAYDPRPIDPNGSASGVGLFHDPPVTRQEIEEELIRMITDSIDPESWRDNSGTVGSIRPWAGRLIIHQTPENHQKIESLLANLRKGP